MANFDPEKAKFKLQELLTEKLFELKEAYYIETDAADKFKLKKEIELTESELERLKKTPIGKIGEFATDSIDFKIRSIKEKLGAASDYGMEVATEENALSKAVEGLHIDREEEVGLVHLVNCDRISMTEKFWESFDNKGEAAEDFQYYFISACPTQMPPSFAERMVYEIIIEELDDVADSIHARRQPDSQRIKIEDLPVGRNLEKCQKRFKSYVRERFEFADTETFDGFIRTGVPKLPYEYVTVVFEIHERKWKDFITDYIQWMMDTFRCPHKDVPTFIFFFVVYIENLHIRENLNQKQRNIAGQLEEFAEKNDVALLAPLKPVPLADLKAWLMERGERNPNQVEQVIEALVRELKPEEMKLYEEKQLLHMKDIEMVQRLIYNIANEK
ncbi:MAG: hypothetical protein R3350_01565 [Saprospiraceae bacterium]|nr:hypothetical protein [Saprospiraceae bacterium]